MFSQIPCELVKPFFMYKGTVNIQKEALRISQDLDGCLWMKSFQMCYHFLSLACLDYFEQ